MYVLYIAILRFVSVADIVLMVMAEASSELDPPSDSTVTTVYVGGIKPEIKEQDIR